MSQSADESLSLIEHPDSVIGLYETHHNFDSSTDTVIEEEDLRLHGPKSLLNYEPSSVCATPGLDNSTQIATQTPGGPYTPGPYTPSVHTLNPTSILKKSASPKKSVVFETTPKIMTFDETHDSASENSFESPQNDWNLVDFSEEQPPIPPPHDIKIDLDQENHSDGSIEDLNINNNMNLQDLDKIKNSVSMSEKLDIFLSQHPNPINENNFISENLPLQSSYYNDILLSNIQKKMLTNSKVNQNEILANLKNLYDSDINLLVRNNSIGSNFSMKSNERVLVTETVNKVENHKPQQKADSNALSHNFSIDSSDDSFNTTEKSIMNILDNFNGSDHSGVSRNSSIKEKAKLIEKSLRESYDFQFDGVDENQIGKIDSHGSEKSLKIDLPKGNVDLKVNQINKFYENFNFNDKMIKFENENSLEIPEDTHQSAHEIPTQSVEIKHEMSLDHLPAPFPDLDNELSYENDIPDEIIVKSEHSRIIEELDEEEITHDDAFVKSEKSRSLDDVEEHSDEPEPFLKSEHSRNLSEFDDEDEISFDSENVIKPENSRNFEDLESMIKSENDMTDLIPDRLEAEEANISVETAKEINIVRVVSGATPNSSVESLINESNSNPPVVDNIVHNEHALIAVKENVPEKKELAATPEVEEENSKISEKFDDNDEVSDNEDISQSPENDEEPANSPIITSTDKPEHPLHATLEAETEPVASETKTDESETSNVEVISSNSSLNDSNQYKLLPMLNFSASELIDKSLLATGDSSYSNSEIEPFAFDSKSVATSLAPSRIEFGKKEIVDVSEEDVSEQQAKIKTEEIQHRDTDDILANSTATDMNEVSQLDLPKLTSSYMSFEDLTRQFESTNESFSLSANQTPSDFLSIWHDNPIISRQEMILPKAEVSERKIPKKFIVQKPMQVKFIKRRVLSSTNDDSLPDISDHSNLANDLTEWIVEDGDGINDRTVDDDRSNSSMELSKTQLELFKIRSEISKLNIQLESQLKNNASINHFKPLHIRRTSSKLAPREVIGNLPNDIRLSSMNSTDVKRIINNKDSRDNAELKKLNKKNTAIIQDNNGIYESKASLLNFSDEFLPFRSDTKKTIKSQLSENVGSKFEMANTQKLRKVSFNTKVDSLQYNKVRDTRKTDEDITETKESTSNDIALPEPSSEIVNKSATPELPLQERGRLFVKVRKLVKVDLPDAHRYNAKFSITLDNSNHVVKTNEFKLENNSTIDQEFELTVMDKLEFILTLKAHYNKPSNQLIEVTETEVVKSKNRISRLFGSKEIIRRTKFVEQTTQDKWKNLMANDGSFAKCYINFDQYETKITGKSAVFSFFCFNEWEVLNQETHIRKTPYKIGQLEVEMLYIPRTSAHEIFPSSIKTAHENIMELRKEMGYFKEGYLNQEGGDCEMWKKRFFKLEGTSLIAHSAETHKTRAKINLSKVTDIVYIDNKKKQNRTGKNYRDFTDVLLIENGFRLRFANDEIIDLGADSEKEKYEWIELMETIIYRNKFRRQPWVKLLMENSW